MKICGVFANFMAGSMLLHSTLTLQTCLQRKVYRERERERERDAAKASSFNKGCRALYECHVYTINKRTKLSKSISSIHLLKLESVPFWRFTFL
jgi:hypothetical protein